MKKRLAVMGITGLVVVLLMALSPVAPTADNDWVMGDLARVATAVGVSPTAEGKYDVSEILYAMLDIMGVEPRCAPCQACLARINSVTKSDFMSISQIGEVRASSLVAAQPFEVSSCSVYSIEEVLDAVPDIGLVLRERIVRYFCPEIYEE